MKEFRKCISSTVLAVITPSQVGLAKFLTDKQTYLSLGAFLQQRGTFFAG